MDKVQQVPNLANFSYGSKQRNARTRDPFCKFREETLRIFFSTFFQFDILGVFLAERFRYLIALKKPGTKSSKIRAWCAEIF